MIVAAEHSGVRIVGPYRSGCLSSECGVFAELEEEVIAESGPEDKTVAVDLSEPGELVLDEADEVDFEEDGLSIETADEFKTNEEKEEA